MPKSLTVRTLRAASGARELTKRNIEWKARALLAAATASVLSGRRASQSGHQEAKALEDGEGQRNRRPALAAFVSAASLTVAAITGGAGSASAASGPTRVAGPEARGLKQSTGNLYWTTNYSSDIDRTWGARVYRASKGNTPGNEITLYTESRQDRFSFGDITYANVGAWYGYFAANYHDLGVYAIKRVSLTGGSAVILARSSSSIRDLETDGTSLYWTDASGMRKMAIGGGSVTTLVSSSNITSIGLDSTRVFYATGTTVRSIPKTGGTSTTHVVGSTNVTAMHIHPGPARTVIFWGEQNASVKSRPLGGISTVHQAPIAGRSSTTVSYDGTRVLWADCAMPGSYGCKVQKREGAITTTVKTGGVGARNIQGDASTMFWTEGGVWKYVH